MQSSNSKKPRFDNKDITFYSGKYYITGNTVTHHVLNANSSALYGKNLKRKIKIINNSKMSLIVKSKNNSLIRLNWKKV